MIQLNRLQDSAGRILISVVFLVCGSACEWMPQRLHTAKSNGFALEKDIDAVVEDEMKANSIVGVAIGISKDGETLIAKGYGSADLENDVPVTSHTVFRIGSITKQFTAVGILMLAERSLLDLDDDITKYIGDYYVPEQTVTIRHLLNHTSGIFNFTGLERHRRIQRLDATHRQIIGLFADEPLEFTPGERYKYSNTGYYLLGMIIKEVTGKKYREFLQEEVLDPFGLKETHRLLNDPIVPNRAEGYRIEDDKILNDEPISMHIPFSAGAIGASVSDLLKWQHALHGQQILKGETYQELITPPTIPNGQKSQYACGLKISQFKGHRTILHGGGIPGFDASMSYYPDSGLSIVVLCNTRGPDIKSTRVAENLWSLLTGGNAKEDSHEVR